MSFLKKDKLRILGGSIILILLLVPGITLAEQAIKTVYKKMVATETVEPIEEQQDAGEPITADSAANIEQGLNESDLTQINEKIQAQELYGNKLVFVDASTQELISYNLKTKERISISKTNNYKEQLAIFKNKVIWTELNEIWAYDYSDKSAKNVTKGDMSDLYGDMLVYRGVERPGIYLYNFKTEKTVTITEKPNGVYTPPTIWKNIITWADDSDGYLNVYYYDLKKDETIKITNFSEERYLGNPLATKNSIVYPLVDEEGVRQLMEYNLKSGKTITIPGLKKGKFRITVDKFTGDSINYYRTYDEVVTVDLKTKEVTEYAPVDNKAVYGGVIIGTQKDAPKFKVHRNN